VLEKRFYFLARSLLLLRYRDGKDADSYVVTLRKKAGRFQESRGIEEVSMNNTNRKMISLALFVAGIALTLLVQAAEIKVTEYKVKRQWNPLKQEVQKLVMKSSRTKKIKLDHLNQF